MTFKFGNPVSTEWEKIKEFVFRKEIIDVSCQEGKVIQLLKKYNCNFRKPKNWVRSV